MKYIGHFSFINICTLFVLICSHISAIYVSDVKQRLLSKCNGLKFAK